MLRQDKGQAMTQPIDYHTPGIPLDFKNRKTGLVVYGVFLILFGSLAGCLTIAVPITIVRGQGGETSAGGIISALLAYAGVATGLIWTGIGSIRAQRWTRPIVLIIGTITLVMVAVSGLALLTVIPQMNDAIAGSATTMPAPAVSRAMTWGFIAAMVLSYLIYLLIPAAFVAFYRSEDVLRTLQYYDPQPRWTEQCPLPVLGAAIASALVAAGMLLAAIGSEILTVFGVFVTSPMAMLGQLLIGGVFATTGYLLFRLDSKGWALAVVITTLSLLSAVVSIVLIDPEALIAGGASAEEIAAIMGFGEGFKPIQVATALMLGLGSLGYLLYLRKYFFASSAATVSRQ